MTRMEKSANFSRRALLKAGGALVVSIGAPVTFDFAQADDAASTAAMSVTVKPALTPDQLSSYVAVNADGTIAAYFGKMDMGHGIAVAIAQMVAEELDAPFSSVQMFMGDTATSVNQGGASGSTGVEEGGKQMRLAAAEARRVLVEMAADRLGLPADQLAVTDAVVHSQSRSGKKGVLPRTRRRPLFQRAARLERQDRQPASGAGQGRAESPEGLSGRRPADQTRRRRAARLRANGFQHRRQSAGHGARPHDPSGRCRRGAGQGRRKLDQGYSGRQSCLEPGLPRRRRRQGMGRHQSDAAAQGRMVGREAAVPRKSVRDLRLHPQRTGAQKRSRRQDDRRRRSGLQERRARDRGGIRMAVPVPCQHGPGLRSRRHQG